MPTYEYACTSCDNRFERWQSIHDATLVTCEVCGGTLRKVFHPAGIVLKGSGFYKTDSRKSSSSSSSSSSSKPASESKPKSTATESSSSSSSDSSSSSSSSDPSSSTTPAATGGSKE